MANLSTVLCCEFYKSEDIAILFGLPIFTVRTHLARVYKL